MAAPSTRARDLERLWNEIIDRRKSTDFEPVRRELEIAERAIEMAMERIEEYD